MNFLKRAFGKKESSEGGVDLRTRAKRDAQAWWAGQGRSSGICDVCNGPVSKVDSYLLQSADILRSEAYFDQAASLLAGLGGFTHANAKAAQRAQVEADKTPWMVCPKCIGLFD